ncbi:MAG TPA: oxidoreductase [Bacteroidales bacterium]|nr:oxidoreductase [Bacteroidales bacterium]
MTEFNPEKVSSRKGRIAIITGSNTGLGYETAKILAGTGMKVIMACRNMEKAESAKKMILKTHPGSDLEIMPVDLSRLASVRNFADMYMSAFDRVDLLINNAGIMIPPYSLTEDGFESQMGVNYFAHFLLTALLFDTIVKTPGSRIVALSSNAHKKGEIRFEDLNRRKDYNPLNAYRQSKVACLIFAKELDRRIRRAGLETLSVAAHPGLSITELVRHIPKWVMVIGKPLTAIVTHPPAKGAMPVVYAALSPDVKGGEYFGPQGYNEWKGEPGRVDSTSYANDKSIAARLWDISEKLTGVNFNVNSLAASLENTEA